VTRFAGDDARRDVEFSAPEARFYRFARSPTVRRT